MYRISVIRAAGIFFFFRSHGYATYTAAITPGTIETLVGALMLSVLEYYQSDQHIVEKVQQPFMNQNLRLCPDPCLRRDRRR